MNATPEDRKRWFDQVAAWGSVTMQLPAGAKTELVTVPSKPEPDGEVSTS